MAEALFLRATSSWEILHTNLELQVDLLDYDTSFLDARKCPLFARKFGSETTGKVSPQFEFNKINWLVSK